MHLGVWRRSGMHQQAPALPSFTQGWGASSTISKTLPSEGTELTQGHRFHCSVLFQEAQACVEVTTEGFLNRLKPLVSRPCRLLGVKVFEQERLCRAAPPSKNEMYGNVDSSSGKP